VDYGNTILETSDSIRRMGFGLDIIF